MAELAMARARDIRRDFELSGAAKVVERILKDLGIAGAVSSAAELEASLRKAREQLSRGTTVLAPLLNAPDKRARWRSLLIVLLGAPLAGWLAAVLLTLLGQEAISQITGAFTGVALLLARGAAWLRVQAEWVSRGLARLEDAQRAYDRELDEERARASEQIAKLEQELDLARQDYTAAQRQAEEARREEGSVKAALEVDASPAGLLARFVQDRAGSSDYRKHLGVLALVRDDFERLSALIEAENWRLEPPGEAELYIDDLDRCPPAKVVEVLQAVHLLLAFPLFVVVVGVDARWITQSLETRRWSGQEPG